MSDHHGKPSQNIPLTMFNENRGATKLAIKYQLAARRGQLGKIRALILRF